MSVYMCGSKVTQNSGVVISACHNTAEDAQGCALLHIKLLENGRSPEATSLLLHPELLECEKESV